MKRVSLFYPFALALVAALFSTVFFPRLRLLPFAPFLALASIRLSFQRMLWVAFLCGLILDLVCVQLRFGAYALTNTLVVVAIYKQRRHFTEDKPLELCIFTALISFLSTVCLLFFLFAFDKQLPFTPSGLLTDLIGMPLLDALYAFLWFTCPIRTYLHIQRVGWKQFLRIEKQT